MYCLTSCFISINSIQIYYYSTVGTKIFLKPFLSQLLEANMSKLNPLIKLFRLLISSVFTDKLFLNTYLTPQLKSTTKHLPRHSSKSVNRKITPVTFFTPNPLVQNSDRFNFLTPQGSPLIAKFNDFLAKVQVLSFTA